MGIGIQGTGAIDVAQLLLDVDAVTGGEGFAVGLDEGVQGGVQAQYGVRVQARTARRGLHAVRFIVSGSGILGVDAEFISGPLPALPGPEHIVDKAVVEEENRV
ncbi:hypothetical protein D3C73_1232030 [compost metagenome]